MLGPSDPRSHGQGLCVQDRHRVVAARWSISSCGPPRRREWSSLPYPPSRASTATATTCTPWLLAHTAQRLPCVREESLSSFARHM